MDFLELAKNRYSCRYFSNKKIEQEKIDKILEAARLAPTGRNSQSQRILVLTDEAEFTYKCDDLYNPTAEGGLKWDDPDVGIEWPLRDMKVEDLLTSEKDGKWPSLKELKETDLFSNLK